MRRKLLLAYFKNFVFLHVLIIVVAVGVKITRTVHTCVRPLAQSLSDAIYVSPCNQSHMLKTGSACRSNKIAICECYNQK